jgi:hypothetical protein
LTSAGKKRASVWVLMPAPVFDASVNAPPFEIHARRPVARKLG